MKHTTLVKLILFAAFLSFFSCRQPTPITINPVVIHDTIHINDCAVVTTLHSSSSATDSIAYYKEKIRALKENEGALKDLIKMYQNGKKLQQ